MLFIVDVPIYIIYVNYKFTFPLTVHTVFFSFFVSLLHSHQRLLFLVFFITTILTGVRWYPVVLICISLMISVVEHLFIYLLAICMFSLEKCLIRYCTHVQSDFLNLSFFFFFLCILDINPLSEIWFVNMFSYSVGFFSLCEWFPCCAEAFIVWYSSTCLFFLLLPLLLVSNPENHHWDWCQRAYCLSFLLGALCFQILHSSL